MADLALRVPPGPTPSSPEEGRFLLTAAGALYVYKGSQWVQIPSPELQLPLENFATPGYVFNSGDDTTVVQNALTAGATQNRIVMGGSRSVRVSSPLTMKGPGLVFEPIGGGPTENSINWIGGDNPTNYILHLCGTTPGTDPARVQKFSATVNGNGYAVGGIWLDFFTFSDSDKVRIINCKGTALRTQRMQDCVQGDISIERCGWSTYGNSLATGGVDDGLSLEAPAFYCDGTGGAVPDTTNATTTLRLQIEQCRFKILVAIHNLQTVWMNIHSERALFTSWDTTAWWFEGARSTFINGRFHANSNINYCDDAENINLWTNNNSCTVTSKVIVDGEVMLDRLDDANAGSFAWRSKTLRALPSTGTKNFSVVVRKPVSGAASYSEFQVIDVTANAVLVAMGINWSGTTPVFVGGSGIGSWDSMEQLLPLSANEWRLYSRFTLSNIAHTHEVRLFPAGNGTAGTGKVEIGGIYVGNATTAESYVKTGNTSYDPRSILPPDQNAKMLAQGETMTYDNFNMEGAAQLQLRGAPGAIIKVMNSNLNGKVYIDTAGGGGAIEIESSKIVKLQTGIDPAIPNALTIEKCEITEAIIGDCGNPAPPSGIVFRRCNIASITGDSTLSACTLIDCPNVVTASPGYPLGNTGGTGGYALVVVRSVLATPGATLTLPNYTRLIDAAINQATVVPSAYTLIASGRTRFNGNLTFSGNCASLLGPECHCTGTVSGLGVPAVQPSVGAQRNGVWRLGDTGFNMGTGVAIGAAYGWTCTTPGATGAFGFSAISYIGGGLGHVLTVGTYLAFASGVNFDGSADRQINTNATDVATASTLAARNANADIAFRDVTARDLLISRVLSVPSSGGAPTSGNASLTSGSVTISTTAITGTMEVMVARRNGGSNWGNLYHDSSVISIGSSFTIKSDNPLDNGIVAWWLVEKH